MAAMKTKGPNNVPIVHYTSGPTPVADFIEKVWKGIVIAFMAPVLVIVLTAMPAYFLIEGLGNVTGLTPAWAELVAHASAPIGAAIPFASMLLQNLVVGAAITLLLGIPAIRRCFSHHKVREIAKSVGTSTAVAAMELSFGAVLLYAVLGLLIGAAITWLGLVLPVPGGYDTVVAPYTFAFTTLTGSGGGWPPTMDELSMFAVMTLAALLLLGMLLGAALWTLFLSLAKAAATGGAAEAASGGASALGSSLALAVTRGHDTGYDSFVETVWRGIGHGAISGAAFALVILVGAAVLGVG